MIRNRLMRWLLCLAVVLLVMITMLRISSLAAKTPLEPSGAVDPRLQAVGNDLQALPVYPATDTTRHSAAKPVAPVEGPTPVPDNTRRSNGFALSLADQRGFKGMPRLTLSAPAGKPGDAVRIVGRGYAPQQRIDLYWDGVNVTGRQAIITEWDGTFATLFDIPHPMTNGVHTIKALEAHASGALQAASSQVSAGGQATFVVNGGLPPGSALPSLTPEQVHLSIQPATDTLPNRPAAVKAWTFAVYLAGDNSLSDYADINLQQMAAAAHTNPNDNVNVVVLVDKKTLPTKYYRIDSTGLADVTPGSVSGNIDTGSPQKFVDFMTWVNANYPANKYAVVVWDHGGGWKAVESDDPTGDYWNMSELRTALQGGLAALGKPQYDILIFDACLMAQYEVGLTIKDYVNVLGASEETVPGVGTPYDKYLPTLLTNPGVTADAFGADLVAKYGAFYGPAGAGASPEYTFSALKLEAPFDSLQTKVNAFSNALLVVGPTSAGDIQLARDAARKYHDEDFVDLGDFALQIKNRITDAAVQSTATDLLNALSPSASGVVLAESNGANSSGSQGLSVYLPSPAGRAWGGRGFSPAYDDLTVKGTYWYTFTQAFYTGQYSSTTPVSPPPPPPPPAASSTSDIVYARQLNTTQFDLYRIQAVAYPTQTADTFALLSDGYANSYPRWSADGKLVVYASNRGGTTATDLDLNLFLIKADGTPLDGYIAPRQLTNVGVNCAGGPGTGAPCVIEQAYDPAWVSDAQNASVGVLYTKLQYDLTATDPGSWTVKQGIHYLYPITSPTPSDIQILPSGPYKDDIMFANADFNGKFLMFTYSAPVLPCSYTTLPDFCYNHVGFVDYTVNPPVLRYFVFNHEADYTAGNYLLSDYPAWRLNRNELAFLYTRYGDPLVMQGLDPRTPPAAGEPENPYPTYDIGRLTFGKIGATYYYTMETPIWPFAHPDEGEGANFRPSWKPDDSGNLTASYARDGYTFNVGLFLSAADNTPGDRAFLITADGYSGFPSWGKVSAANVQARLDIKPQYLQPGAFSSYYLAGDGFGAGETVQLLRSTTPTVTSVISTVIAGADGSFQAPFKLSKGSASPGPLYFKAAGQTSSRQSNLGMLVVLAPRSIGPSFIYLPLVRRNK